MEFTPQQAHALEEIDRFIASEDPEDKVFILTGYAGTGKTTIIKEILRANRDKDFRKMLMAPTGKAAKVLKERTGFADACTLHIGIFSRKPVFVEQENDDIETTEVRISFPIRYKMGTENKCLCIIDEASMVSSRRSHNENLFFGTGIMLEDIMTFVSLNPKSKVIFIGDPAQLPPVGDNESNALNPEWFKAHGYAPKHFELTEVVRQGLDSTILRNSLKIRELLESDVRNELIFETNPGEIDELRVEEMTDLFVDNWKNGDKGAIITFKNSSAYSYNLRVREKLGCSESLLAIGDRLMVIHNNYVEGMPPLMNGDYVEIEEIYPGTESFKIPLKKKINGKVESKTITLEFVDALVINEEGEKMPRKLLTNLLNSNAADLIPEEQRALYVFLCMRNPGVKDKTEITNLLAADPYYNALRVKYGYAITGHKAQGSEWHTGYIDYTGRLGLSDDTLRWIYTATTRAKARMFGIGIPAINPISKLEFKQEIVSLSKSPSCFYPAGISVPETPFHKRETKASIKMKYWLANEALNEKGYAISEVQSQNWRESYIIDNSRYDATYDGQGVFKRFTAVTDCNQEVLDALNSTGKISFEFTYAPEAHHLKTIYQQMSSLCEKHDICISNIEMIGQYTVRYSLITEAFEFACIDFWFNGKAIFTRAIASSSLGNNDEKLKRIIEEF